MDVGIVLQIFQITLIGALRKLEEGLVVAVGDLRFLCAGGSLAASLSALHYFCLVGYTLARCSRPSLPI